MLESVKPLAKRLLSIYSPWICRWEFNHQKVTRFNERPVEFGFIFRKLSEVYPRRILDVGTGITALPFMMRNCGFLVTAIDNVRDYWPSGMTNRHYHVIDDDITNTRIEDKFDFITCISVLEHIERADDAVRNMFSLLNPGGHLVMTFPYSEGGYVRNVYDLPGSSYGQDVGYTTQSFSRAELERWVQASQAVIVEQEYWQFWEGEHWTVGEQVLPPKRVGAEERHQLTCVHLKKS